MKARFRGLTWDHPRGYNALAAAAEHRAFAGKLGTPLSPPGRGQGEGGTQRPSLVEWDRQPLEGFESHPIADLAARYDLLVLDHPHIGEAVAENCLTPLQDIFTTDEIAAWEAQTIGRAMASYFWAGRHWALPLDVATQVTACRADLLGDAPPADWREVVRLSEGQPVALSLAGPHAILNLFSVAVALGVTPGGDDLMRDDIAAEALALLRAIARRVPAGSTELNPIGLLETMATGDAIALVPLVYGYVNYSTPAAGRRKISFVDAPTIDGRGIHGSVLGGTGIAITRRARPDAALLDHLRWLMRPDTQRGFIPDHDGQSSSRAAWLSDEVDAKAGGFYSATRKTAESAFVRPRSDGYVAFQAEASAIVRRALLDGAGDRETVDALKRAWRERRAKARGPLE
jgi:multiple sugar transport system substrate-binding protein